MKKRTVFEEHWATPPAVYRVLNEEFNFDFDPCPILEESEITSPIMD